MTDPEDNMTSYTYDAYGNIRTETRPNGSITSYEYDSLNRVTKEYFQATTEVEKVLLKTYSYSILADNKTQKIETVYLNDTDIAVTSYTYDYAGRQVKQVNPDGGIIIVKYNANGTIHSSVDAKGKTTYYKYDGLNRLTEQWKPFGEGKYTYQSITYDKKGNKTSESVGIDAVALWSIPFKKLTSYYKYDCNNHLITSTNSAENVTEYEYDANGNVSKETIYLNDTDKKITEYEYNYLGKVDTMIQHLEAGIIYGSNYDDITDTLLVTSFTYDANGNVKSMKTPDKVITVYEYDNLNRLISQSVQGFDEYGNEVRKTTETTYDFAGNVLTSKDANGNITENQYNQRGLLERTIDPQNGVTAYYYDNVGRLTAKVLPKSYLKGKSLSELSRAEYIYDNMSRIILTQDIYYDETTTSFQTIHAKSYKYDLNGNVIKTLDALGYQSGTGATITEKINTGYGTTNSYNDANLLLTTQSPVAKERGLSYDLKYTYDAAGRKVSETNANNVTFMYYYDGVGRLTKTSLIDSTEKTLQESTYDGIGNVLTQTDAKGNTTTYTYNNLGLVSSKTTPGDECIDAYSVWYQYNVLGHLSYQKDSMGKTICYTNNHDGQVLSQTEQAENGSKSITLLNAYDKNGNLRFATDGNGVKTEYTYDAFNRVHNTIIYVNDVQQITTNEYDDNGNQILTTDWLGNTYTNIYDPLNRLMCKKDPYGKVIGRYEYNHNHAQVMSYDALGNETAYTYDKNNRLISTTNPEGSINSQTYDNVGNLATKTDGRSNVTTYGYDKLNRLTKVTNAKGEITSYTYDLNGNQLTQTDAKGNTITFIYNAVNLLTSREEPKAASGVAKKDNFTYYANGLIHNKIDKNGKVFTYTYDIHGNLLSEAVEDDVITYTYDNNKNMLTMKDQTGVTIRTYDELGRVLTKTVPNVGTISYDYDITVGVIDGCYQEISTDPLGNVTKKLFDKDRRLSQVIVGDEVTTYTYYGNGNRQSVIYDSGMREEYTYNAKNQVKSLINRSSDGSIMDSYTYTYDQAGNQETKYEIINGVAKGTTSYTYDSLNRLYTVTEPNGRTTSYTYDKAGNREIETIVEHGITSVSTYTYNNQNRLTEVTTKVNNILEQVTSYSYDHNGNQLTTSMRTYRNGTVSSEKVTSTNTYDNRNQLIKTVTEDDKVIEHSYNAQGYRVIKKADGKQTYFLYEADQVILEVDEDGQQKAYNVYGTNLLMRTVGGQSYYYMYNGHADVTALITSSGAIAATYNYDAFGNILNETGNVKNNIRYAGYQYDEETGLYYLNARMYDPEIARFIQEDTYYGDPNDPLSLNLYTYCANNPIMYVDPTGHTPVIIEGGEKVVAALIALGSYIVVKSYPLLEDAAKGLIDTAKDVAIYIGNTAEDVAYGVAGALGLFTETDLVPVKNEIWHMPPHNRIVDVTNKVNLSDIFEQAVSKIEGADNTVSDDDYDDSYDDYYDTGKTERVGKQKGNAPRDNQKQNEQTDKIAQELGLTKEQSRQLHDYITGQGYSYKEILDIAKDLFVKK